MTESYYLRTLQDGVEIATTLTKSWFRGQPVIGKPLRPRMFREEYERRKTGLFANPDIELETIEDFQRYAPTLAESPLPLGDDRLGWLCLMQHYGCPTRLLDWTENALVALYFATSTTGTDADADGEVWAMLPWALNRAAGAGWAIPLSGARELTYLLEQPFWEGTAAALSESLHLTNGPVLSPMPIMPPLFFTRVLAQSGVFTIHPAPGESTHDIESVLPDPRHLVRYVVPKEAKTSLRAQLDNLGFNEMRLFPGLEALSRWLVYEHRIAGYGPPRPPKCSGPVSSVPGDSSSQPAASETSSPV